MINKLTKNKYIKKITKPPLMILVDHTLMYSIYFLFDLFLRYLNALLHTLNCHVVDVL